MPDQRPASMVPAKHGGQQAGEVRHPTPLQKCKSPFSEVAPAADVKGVGLAQGDACLGGTPSGHTHHAAHALPLSARISGSKPAKLPLQPDSRGDVTADAFPGGSHGGGYSGHPHIHRLKSSGRLALSSLDATSRQSAPGLGTLPEPEEVLGDGAGLNLPAPRQPWSSHIPSDQALRAQLRGPPGTGCHVLFSTGTDTVIMLQSKPRQRAALHVHHSDHPSTAHLAHGMLLLL